MTAGLIEILQTLVVHYGLLGLFFASFVGSTIFIPFPTELVFPVLLAYSIPAWCIWLTATASSVVGLYLNYLVGFQSVKYINKVVHPREHTRLRKFIKKHGDLGLFMIIVLPAFPADPLTVVAGMIKMDVREFLIVALLAKAIRYATFLGLIQLFI